MIGQTLARYRIVADLASGAMGTVYQAEDRELGRSIALKVLPQRLAADPSRLARFHREARALAAVNHPNIVVIHSVEEVDNIHFLTMELVNGCNLEAVINNGGVTFEEFFNIALPLVAALEAAHAQGIIHRDLKPANVMLTAGGQVKVLDFGLAKLVSVSAEADPAAATEAAVTRSEILGTPLYMSPEQARGEEADTRSDIFSAGALLYHLLTGHRPFRGTAAAEVLASVLRDDPPPAASLRPGCPPHLSRLLDLCLAKNPTARLSTATELMRELEGSLRFLESNGHPLQSIAVLPFADLSPDRDQEHFCSGIAEEIINALTGLEGLKVVSRMTSFQFREMGGDSRDIGRQLGVTALLEGSVRLAGDRLRIMAQLIDVADSCHIWSQRFDREIEDIFQVQDEIALSIVKALQVAIGPDGQKRLVDVHTLNPAAYDVYLRGREFFRRWGKRNIEIAQRMFLQAVDLDPNYAAALAGLADTYSYLYMYINSSDENLEQADVNSARALVIDPALAEAHAARGLALSLNRNFEAADRAFRTASELDANLFEAYYFAARNCVVQGRREAAISYYEQAAAASPADYQIPILTAQIHQSLGQDDAARDANRLGMELAEKAILANPEDARACYMGAGAMIRLGQRERGLKWARRALALDPDDPAILYNVACNLAGLGEVEEAIACLENTVKVGAAYREWMENDTDLDPLRDHPRFRKLVASLG
ncbi:hypothetical protein DRQ50_15100 [bacterium]|nr:MAG: hypothetical protein DRQ50_15100 [bacterium]